MSMPAESLPHDVETLKALLIEHVARNAKLEARVLALQEQLNLAMATNGS